jgi:hypothetical protein
LYLAVVAKQVTRNNGATMVKIHDQAIIAIKKSIYSFPWAAYYTHRLKGAPIPTKEDLTLVNNYFY